ncbi:MAG TPA: hypothetical protein VGX28_02375 [Frankiaceae bacterium]|nr:hypothetical protein [Frankiaceae bacterium]
MRARRWFWWSAALFAAFLGVGLVVPASRGRQDRVAVLTGVLVVCVLVRRSIGVGTRPEPETGYGPADLGIADEQDVRLARLDTSVARAAESAEHYANAFVPMLRRLAKERLADRAGIDADADPAGARRVMGEELWEIFATRPDAHGRAPEPARLRVLVERLERL